MRDMDDVRSIVTNYHAKIRDPETLTSAQKSRLRDPRNFTKILREVSSLTNTVFIRLSALGAY